MVQRMNRKTGRNKKMSEQEKEVVVVPNQSLSEMTDDIIASAERRIANIQRVIGLAIKITNNNDWVDQSGKPWPTASAAEKIGRLFGVCWSNIKGEIDEKINRHSGKITIAAVIGLGIMMLRLLR